MHEASVIADLVKHVDDIVRADGALRATLVSVVQGELGHLSPDHLRGHFTIAAVGTLAEGAVVEVRSEGDGDDLRLVAVTVEYD
jgi:Zn finger protein HypA/HybF involved in hydrogenase expression